MHQESMGALAPAWERICTFPTLMIWVNAPLVVRDSTTVVANPHLKGYTNEEILRKNEAFATTFLDHQSSCFAWHKLTMFAMRPRIVPQTTVKFCWKISKGVAFFNENLRWKSEKSRQISLKPGSIFYQGACSKKGEYVSWNTGWHHQHLCLSHRSICTRSISLKSTLDFFPGEKGRTPRETSWAINSCSVWLNWSLKDCLVHSVSESPSCHK